MCFAEAIIVVVVFPFLRGWRGCAEQNHQVSREGKEDNVTYLGR